MLKNVLFYKSLIPFSKLLGKQFPARVKKCVVIETPKNMPEGGYGSHMVIADAENYMSVSFLWRDNVRIEECCVENCDTFRRIMDAIYHLAKVNRFDRIFYAGKLREDAAKMFLSYGFAKQKAGGDYWNCYLELVGIMNGWKKEVKV